MRTELLSEIMSRAYEAAYVSGVWIDALDALSAATAAKGAILYAFDPLRHTEFNLSRTNQFFVDHAEMMIEYHQRFVEGGEGTLDSEGIRMITKSDPFVPIRETELWPLESYLQKPEVQFTLERAGLKRRVACNISDSSDIAAGILLQYPQDLNNIPEIDIRSLSYISPHLGKAASLAKFFSPLERRYKAVLSALDKFNVGLCVLDHLGRHVLSNVYAAELLEEKDPLFLSKDGFLGAKNEAENYAIQKAWAEMANTANGEGCDPESTVFVTRTQGDAPILAMFSPLKDALGEIDKTLKGSLVTFVDPLRTVHRELETLARVWQLTRAETDVAEIMASGASTNEIAEMRNASPMTVSTQIKSILAKSRIRNRTEFVWRLYQASPPLL